MLDNIKNKVKESVVKPLKNEAKARDKQAGSSDLGTQARIYTDKFKRKHSTV